ncbi:hypothetical protein C1T31_07150 [Hanstruepera neustonica]|uniref:Polymerase nucleotidyl transferase domain-containing protein n=1 Tax=Hanstruepera neustonica TaxID=1445657 RepID=A0A2K1DZ29_9FLAO|nr:hypothetical protein [Hanstruepera neustonica]PNQ73289.1 hypothetical protein C1T31_07150 [Hanstruepera neustonica]
MKKEEYIVNGFDENMDFLLSLNKLIEGKYSELFFAVIAHGSVGTNEIIPYSDFDGLLIVKDHFINSQQLEKFKFESMKLILKFDPLQHHGWFQITESQLSNYPQSYLPHEVLIGSKVIYPKIEKLELQVVFNIESLDYMQSLKQLINSIEKQYINYESFKDVRVYELKSFLSKIMLLPSMYYAAKNEKGIFKKQSFDAVRFEFKEEEWACIEMATLIRRNWSYNLNPIQRFVMTRPEIFFRRLTKKMVAPKPSKEIFDTINEDFFKSLKLFIKKINKDIFVA